MDSLFASDDRRKVTLDEARAIYFGRLPRGIAELAPDERERQLQCVNQEWEKFCGKLEPGDELWEFRSPPHKWKMLMGQHGIEVLRNGETIETMLLLVN